VLAAPLIAGQVPLHIDGEFRGIVGVARWPEPYVVFMEFGDNGLLFELRVFMTNVDNVLTVQSDLNFAIEAAYREAGIDMPFQQQEIHWQDIDKLTDAIRSIGKSGFLSA
jgi:potassium efflux system protein